jgi:DNA-binding MarR family transcriptional regulator
VLRELDQGGPQTVPQLARTRSVTRQHVQAQVNALAEWGLVELIDNPAHKRSRLVRLTSAGRESVAELERRALDRLGRLETSMGLTEVRAAIAVIRAVAAAPESDD